MARELTARGRGGVSVVEVSGERARVCVARLLATGQSLPVGALRVMRLMAGDELLDEALVWAASEGRVELHLHGAPPLVDRVLAELATLGASPPDAARALSLEERALACMGFAAGESAARVLLDQSDGRLRRELASIVAAAQSTVSKLLEPELKNRMERLARRGEQLRFLFEPPVVVLAGPVNAGKSTLFNTLVGHERVIVDEERGTTRDAVRERVTLGAYTIDLVDTAGERELGTGAAADVERAGQMLGRSLREAADLVLWLEPAGGMESDARSSTSGPPIWCVLTSRADELSPLERSRVPAPVSSDDPVAMRTVVAEAVLGALALPAEPWSRGDPQPVPFERDLVAALWRAAAGETEDVIALERAFLR